MPRWDHVVTIVVHAVTIIWLASAATRAALTYNNHRGSAAGKGCPCSRCRDCPARAELNEFSRACQERLRRRLRRSSTLDRTCPAVPELAAIGSRDRSGQGALVGADDLEVLVDEDVVRPVDADVVDLVLAVAQLDNTVDDASRVGGQRSFRRLIRCRSADDRP